MDMPRILELFEKTHWTRHNWGYVYLDTMDHREWFACGLVSCVWINVDAAISTTVILSSQTALHFVVLLRLVKIGFQASWMLKWWQSDNLEYSEQLNYPLHIHFYTYKYMNHVIQCTFHVKLHVTSHMFSTFYFEWKIWLFTPSQNFKDTVYM